MSIISKHLSNVDWKKQCRHKTILKERAKRGEGDQGEFSSHLLQMQEILHYHSECPKLTKEKPKKSYFKGKVSWQYGSINLNNTSILTRALYAVWGKNSS